MCACMPAVRTLFSHIAPKVFGSTQRSGDRTEGTHGTMGVSSSRPIRTKSDTRSKEGDSSSFVELLPVETGDRFESATADKWTV